MSKSYPIFQKGQRVGDRVITQVDLDPDGRLMNTYYHYLCDCGATGWILHGPMCARVVKKHTGCPTCKRSNKMGATQSFDYKQAGEVLAMVDKYWR